MNLPTSHTLQTAIDRALVFLAKQQKTAGDFPTFVASDEAMQQNRHEDPTVFMTQHIVASLLEVKNQAALSISLKAKQFLVSEAWYGNIWRFWTKNHAGITYLAPDTDDTSCTAYLLRSELNLEQTQAVLLGNRNQAGLFYTWILPRMGHLKRPLSWLPLAAVVKNPFKLYKFFQMGQVKPKPNHIDIVVNANAVLFLGESAMTAPTIAWISQVVKEGKEASSDRFYQSRYPLYYAIVRCAQTGIKAFEPLKELITTRLKTELETLGQCGNGVMDTALAANVLAYWSPESEQLQIAINFLLKNQQADGSWAISVFYYDGWERSLYWGSAEVITGFCVEAFARALK